MAKAAEEKAGKGKLAAAKPTKSSKPKSAALSQALVVDSDSDDNDAQAAKPGKLPNQPENKSNGTPGKSAEKKIKATPQSKTTPDPKPQSKSKPASKPQAKPKPAPPLPAKLPSPIEISGDEESEESGAENGVNGAAKLPAHAVPKKPDFAPAKVNGIKRKIDENSEDSDESGSEDRSASEKAKQPAAKRVKTTAAATSRASSDSEEDSDDSEDSEKKRPKPSGSASKSTAAPPPEPLAAIPTGAFHPPAGFAERKASDSEPSSLFTSRNLEGKQIWFVTAPAGVPLRSLKEVGLNAIQSGTSVLHHKDDEYRLAEEADPSFHLREAALYSADSLRLQTHKIAKCLRLQHKHQAPDMSKRRADVNTGSAAAGSVSQTSISIIRPQPKGLRMRYKPSGFGAGESGMPGSSSETEDVPPSRAEQGFQFPKALGAHGNSTSQDAGPVPEAGNIKKSKKKTREENGEATNGAKESMTTMPLSTTKATPEKHVNGISPPAQASQDEVLSKEERTKRKEAKKLKKEAKRKALEPGN